MWRQTAVHTFCVDPFSLFVLGHQVRQFPMRTRPVHAVNQSGDLFSLMRERSDGSNNPSLIRDAMP